MKYEPGDVVMLKTFDQLIKEFDYKKYNIGWVFYNLGCAQVSLNEVFCLSEIDLKYLGKEYRIMRCASSYLKTQYLFDASIGPWDERLLYQTDFYKEIKTIKVEIGL
jgi:hypothetical protein